MEKETFTREQLYNEVWKTPLLTLSKKYDISDVGLRKLCLRFNIPVPGVGYWQKLQSGKKVKKIPLPVRNAPEKTIELGLRSEESLANWGKPSPRKIKEDEVRAFYGDSLKVPETLINPDKVIVSTRKFFNAHYKEKWGSPKWSLPHLNLKVSEQQLQRALLLMDTLIKALKKKGYGLQVSGSETIIHIDKQPIKIVLREKNKMVDIDAKSGERTFEATGKFIFKTEAYFIQEWTDGSIGLEEKLPEIIAGLELNAEATKQRKIEREIERREYERKQELKRQLEKRREKDLLSFRETFAKAERWHKANNLRAYIAEVERRAKADNAYTEELQNKLQRLKDQINWYDPFINAKDELLDEVDKTTLDAPRNGRYW